MVYDNEEIKERLKRLADLFINCKSIVQMTLMSHLEEANFNTIP